MGNVKADTALRAVAWYANSQNNPHNPDPDAAVRWGDQTYEIKPMTKWCSVLSTFAVPANMDKARYFLRPAAP